VPAEGIVSLGDGSYVTNSNDAIAMSRTFCDHVTKHLS